jgi:hypothetical protein
MNRSEILKTAEECIMVDRQATHGDAEDNFEVIAALWQTYLAGRVTIDAHDVAAMMVLFKIARFKSNPSHPDNMIDACGYAAFAGEMGMNTKKIPKPIAPVFNDY